MINNDEIKKAKNTLERAGLDLKIRDYSKNKDYKINCCSLSTRAGHIAYAFKVLSGHLGLNPSKEVSYVPRKRIKVSPRLMNALKTVF